MRRNSIKTYGLSVLAATVAVLVLSAVNLPPELATVYLLPMSITILLYELMHLDGALGFYLIFGFTALALNALVFLPVALAAKFKTNTRLILTQVALVVIYLIVSVVVFKFTGGWSSV